MVVAIRSRGLECGDQGGGWGEVVFPPAYVVEGEGSG